VPKLGGFHQGPLQRVLELLGDPLPRFTLADNISLSNFGIERDRDFQLLVRLLNGEEGDRVAEEVSLGVDTRGFRLNQQLAISATLGR
jgi:hypothetical protein